MIGGRLSRPDGTQLWFDVRRSTVGSPSGPVAGWRDVVVLAPPGGRNAAYWPSSFVDELAAAGFDVVLFDWRGQGRSDWPAGAVVAGLAEELVGDLDALCSEVIGAPVAGRPGCDEPAGAGRGGRIDVDSADVIPGGVTLHLVGVGLGGWVAARVAARRRDGDIGSTAAARGESTSNRRAVGRLVLVGSSGWYCDPTLPGPTEPVVVALVMRRRGGGAGELARSIAREVAVEAARPGPVDAGRHLDEAERWLAHGFNPYDDHRPAWLAAPALWPGAHDLADRVLVVHGELDPVVPLDHGRRLAERTAATLHVVAGAGHHADPAILIALADALRWPGRGSAEQAPVRG